MSRPKAITRPAIGIADCEAAVWRLCAVVYRDKKMARIEMAKVIQVIEQFALSCGADPGMVSKGLLPGLPLRSVREAGDGRDRAARVHLGDAGEMAVCKASGVSITNVRDDVTCGNCIRWMKSQDRVASQVQVGVVEMSQRPTLEITPPPPPEPVTTLAGPGKRICRGPCALEKDLQDFARDAKNTEGRKTVCRSCDNARRRAQAAAKRPVAA